jgi:hypothetical protein
VVNDMPNPNRPGFPHSRFSRGELLVGGGSLLLFISFLMTWMSYEGLIAVGVVHGIGLLILLTWLGVVALSVVRSPLLRDQVSFPALPMTDAAVFTVAGTVELACLVLFYIQCHGGIGGYHRSADFGYVLALIGSVLTVAAGVVMVRAGHGALHEMPAPAAPPAPPPPPGPTAGSWWLGTNSPFVPPPPPTPPGPAAHAGLTAPSFAPPPPPPPGPAAPSVG